VILIKDIMMSDTLKYICPDCGGVMIDIGSGILQCADADGCGHEAAKDLFDKALLKDVVQDCQKALEGFDLSFGDFAKLPERITEVLKMATDKY
jgi:ribosomal protein L37AE/L43A